jgi:hypothetical protein
MLTEGKSKTVIAQTIGSACPGQRSTRTCRRCLPEPARPARQCRGHGTARDGEVFGGRAGCRGRCRPPTPHRARSREPGGRRPAIAALRPIAQSCSPGRHTATASHALLVILAPAAHAAANEAAATHATRRGARPGGNARSGSNRFCRSVEPALAQARPVADRLQRARGRRVAVAGTGPLGAGRGRARCRILGPPAPASRCLWLILVLVASGSSPRTT